MNVAYERNIYKTLYSMHMHTSMNAYACMRVYAYIYIYI